MNDLMQPVRAQTVLNDSQIPSNPTLAQYQ